MSKDEMQGVPSEYLVISPLDGRYSEIGKALSPYFSEYGLVKNRVWVEVNWLVFMLENLKGSKILEDFPKERIPDILSIYESFSAESFARVKEIEARNMNETRKDQWQSQVFARILSRYTVILVSEADRSLVESMQMIPSFSIEDAVSKADEILGKKGTINVIANGIASIPS